MAFIYFTDGSGIKIVLSVLLCMVLKRLPDGSNSKRYNIYSFHRIRTFSKAHIRQEFQLRCQSLAVNDNRGFKQEFEVQWNQPGEREETQSLGNNLGHNCVLRLISTKELNVVGKELPTRAGEMEVNKEKNRYPHILPCEYPVWSGM